MPSIAPASNTRRAGVTTDSWITPRTDAVAHGPAAGSFFAMTDHARILETELAAAREDAKTTSLIVGRAHSDIIGLKSELAAEKAERERLTEQVEMAAALNQEAESELARLRAVFPEICKALGNGSCCTPEVTVDFIKSIPNEVQSVVSRLRAENERLGKSDQGNQQIALEVMRERDGFRERAQEAEAALSKIVQGGYAKGADRAHPAVSLARRALSPNNPVSHEGAQPRSCL